MLVAAFGIGIVIGFLFFEITGLIAGGIIVPGYLALFINDPVKILVTLLVSLITYGIVYLFAGRLIVFGKRRFFIMILIGFIIRSILDYLNLFIVDSGIELQAIGYIIPGIIANEFFKQGVAKTVMAITIVVSIVYLILNLLK
ncbi:MAG: poly-gamma-glutamate biosynthesis protein PgsC [Melioribacteraceae bacterium]|nr:poly-gamma-glutamate biosynthesis protein PgsC [Melioribacteraceae bacterium]